MSKKKKKKKKWHSDVQQKNLTERTNRGIEKFTNSSKLVLDDPFPQGFDLTLSFRHCRVREKEG